jgi:uncharacterized protein YkwD
VHGPVDATDDQGTRSVSPSGRHRGRQSMPPPVALGLAVTGLLMAFGAGSALLPASFTGRGTPAELPAAAVAALAPGAGGGAPGARVPLGATPSGSAAPTVRPPSATPKPKPKTTKAPKPKATPRKTTKAPAVGAGQVAQENEVIRLVNVERGKAGCGSVKLNTKLRTAIRLHVEELGTHGNLYISHVSDDGRTFVDRAKAQGYNDPGGENVARGQRDAADVMNSWMNSEGHRANILNCSFKAIGVGRAKGVDGTLVWGQIFGRT